MIMIIMVMMMMMMVDSEEEAFTFIDASRLPRLCASSDLHDLHS
jgi:hypothetical protein